MILKISDSHEETVELFWRLRGLAEKMFTPWRALRQLGRHIRMSHQDLRDTAPRGHLPAAVGYPMR